MKILLLLFGVICLSYSADLPKVIIIDVRTKGEWSEGHINGALHIPLNEIDGNIQSKIKDKNALISIYCASGYRSKLAVSKLSRLGYDNVKDWGGINDAKKNASKYEIISP